jgi:hypothetical protein
MATLAQSLVDAAADLRAEVEKLIAAPSAKQAGRSAAVVSNLARWIAELKNRQEGR